MRYGKLRVENVARSRTSSPRRGALVFGLRLFKIERMLRIFVFIFTLFPLLALAQEEEFTADRPFQFVIYREDAAPELLFWGQIMD